MTDEQLIRIWKMIGKPLPHPGHFEKQRIIREYGKRFAVQTFIETGTFVGYTVWAMLDQFRTIISIELAQNLYEMAKAEFAAYPHVTIAHGDSGQLLSPILAAVSEPCLFWLDGHYSGGITARGATETPILHELWHIFNHPVKDHVILIDDAHMFTGDHDYPTLEQLKQYVWQQRPGWEFVVRNDIICFHKKA